MSSTPWTKTHRLVLLMAWLGWTFDIMDVAVFNLAKQKMVTEFLGGVEQYKLHGPETEGGLMTVFLIAWSIGGVLFGWLTDKFGRARILAWTILFYSVCTGLTALCHNFEQLMVLRFLTGLGVGGEWAAGAAWVAESVPEEKRVRAASWLQSAAAVGPVLAATANIALRQFDWRALFVVGALPALMVFFIRKSASEPVQEINITREVVDMRRYWKTAVGALLLGTVGIATAQNVSFWLPNLVSTVSQGVPAEVLDLRKSQSTFTLHIGTLIGVFLVPWMCQVLNRRVTLLICLVASPILVAIVAVTARTYEALLAMAPLLSVFSIGIGAAFALYFPELFPKSLRATGAGLAYSGARILASGFTFLTGKMIQASGNNVAKSMAETAVIIALGGFSLLLVRETKGQRLSD